MDNVLGTLYGVSVGPGDPELMTVKARRLLERCPVLAVPKTRGGHSLALDIADKAADISGKKVLSLPFPMTTDTAILCQNYAAHAARLSDMLNRGKDVAFICLGDVSVYSTFAYIGGLLTGKGYPVVMVPGVTSFCAAACALGIGLTAANQPLHILPAGYGNIEDALSLSGAKVLMKSASQFPEVRSAVLARGQSAYAAVDCGMSSQRLYQNLADMPDDPGYFTTIIVKEQP
jgi:precorrin-2/cobalt-factor-2 C20-methyltransferase